MRLQTCEYRIYEMGYFASAIHQLAVDYQYTFGLPKILFVYEKQRNVEPLLSFLL